MRVHRPGFALMLVLIAASALVGLAMHAAALHNAAAVETTVAVERSSAQRTAVAAAVLTLKGLTTLAASERDGSAADDAFDAGLGGGDAGPGDGAFDEPEAPDTDVELPEFLKRMLEESGVDLEQGARDALNGGSDGAGGESPLAGSGVGSSSRSLTPRASRSAVLERVGLPAMPVLVRAGDRWCRVHLRDAAGGININLADGAQLLAWLRERGVASPTDVALVNQILDWRDADSVPRERSFETTGYARLGITPRNDRFGSIDELLFLPAMTPVLFEALRDDIRLAGGARVHAPTASEAVLRSLGVLSRREVDELLDLRRDRIVRESDAAEVLDLNDEEVSRALEFTPSRFVQLRVEVLPVRVERRADAAIAEAEDEFVGGALVGGRGVEHVALRAR